MERKYVTFFGGAIRDTSTQEYKDSVLIGKLLGKNDFTVLNGGYGGLMEAVSKGALEEKAQVTGITCETFGKTKGNKYLSCEIKASDIYNRLRHLIQGVNIFIAQKGGIGTLAEVFLALDVNRKLKNETVIYLIGEHWEGIIKSIESVITEKERSLIKFCKSYEDFIREFTKNKSYGF